MLFFCACVEHKFFVHVSPNGSYQVKYSAHGDKMDLQDHDFPMPTGIKWNIHSTLEEVEVESYDYTAHRLFKRNESFPETFFKGDSIYTESLVKHPIDVHHANWFFWETYSFIGIFKGRSINKKYPLIGHLMFCRQQVFFHQSNKHCIMSDMGLHCGHEESHGHGAVQKSAGTF